MSITDLASALNIMKYSYSHKVYLLQLFSVSSGLVNSFTELRSEKMFMDVTSLKKRLSDHKNLPHIKECTPGTCERA